MRLCILALLFITLGCHASQVRRTSSPTPAQDALDVVRMYDAAWNRRDSAAVGRLLAGNYVYFSSRGDAVSRAEFLQLLASPAYVLESADRSELELHVTGASAVVGSRWRGHGTWKGQQFNDDQRCSLVLGRSGPDWRLLSEHCTEILPGD